MEYIGMDVHKQETQVCIEMPDGTVVLEQRIRTTRDRFTAVFGGRPRGPATPACGGSGCKRHGGAWRDRSQGAAPLRTWAQALATRRGKRVAAVALARRRAGILYAFWRDPTDHAPQRVGRRVARPPQAA